MTNQCTFDDQLEQQKPDTIVYFDFGSQYGKILKIDLNTLEANSTGFKKLFTKFGNTKDKLIDFDKKNKFSIYAFSDMLEFLKHGTIPNIEKYASDLRFLANQVNGKSQIKIFLLKLFFFKHSFK